MLCNQALKYFFSRKKNFMLRSNNLLFLAKLSLKCVGWDFTISCGSLKCCWAHFLFRLAPAPDQIVTWIFFNLISGNIRKESHTKVCFLMKTLFRFKLDLYFPEPAKTFFVRLQPRKNTVFGYSSEILRGFFDSDVSTVYSSTGSSFSSGSSLDSESSSATLRGSIWRCGCH